jgi:hypothetical protein
MYTITKKKDQPEKYIHSKQTKETRTVDITLTIDDEKCLLCIIFTISIITNDRNEMLKKDVYTPRRLLNLTAESLITCHTKLVVRCILFKKILSYRYKFSRINLHLLFGHCQSRREGMRFC